MGKVVIFSAPSGAGKTTLVNHLLRLIDEDLKIRFSISATSRPPRGMEQHGVEYYFLSPEEFRQRIANDEFLEYEEVYKDRYYGTLKSEIQRIFDEGGNVIMDVDVVGGCNMKNYFGDQALSIFVSPPSIETLRKRLVDRQTDSPEVIETRIEKAAYEMTFAPQFDIVIVNDDLDKAVDETVKIVTDFLTK